MCGLCVRRRLLGLRRTQGLNVRVQVVSSRFPGCLDRTAVLCGRTLPSAFHPMSPSPSTHRARQELRHKPTALDPPMGLRRSRDSWGKDRIPGRGLRSPAWWPCPALRSHDAPWRPGSPSRSWLSFRVVTVAVGTSEQGHTLLPARGVLSPAPHTLRPPPLPPRRFFPSATGSHAPRLAAPALGPLQAHPVPRGTSPDTRHRGRARVSMAWHLSPLGVGTRAPVWLWPVFLRKRQDP